MPLMLAFRRHDPWWGVDGSAARARYRRQRLVSTLAFVASLVAVGGAGTMWAIHLGFAATLGFRVALAI
jgi:hypothetical protein